MAKRLSIISNVKVAYKDAWAFRWDFLKYSWLIILLKLIFLYVFYLVLYTHFKNWHLIELPQDNFEFHSAFRLYKYVVDACIYPIDSIMFVCLVRMVFLGEKPLCRSFKIKKGDLWEDRTIASVPVYLSFGKRELLWALFYIVPAFFFQLLHDLNLFHLMNVLRDDFKRAHNFVPEFYILGKYFYAITTLGPVYIAVADHLSFSGFLKAIKATKGNGIRILVIAFILDLPHVLLDELFAHIESYVGHPILSFEITHDAAISIPWILEKLSWYLCNFAWVIFIVNAYKNLAPELKDATPGK